MSGATDKTGVAGRMGVVGTTVTTGPGLVCLREPTNSIYCHKDFRRNPIRCLLKFAVGLLFKTKRRQRI